MNNKLNKPSLFWRLLSNIYGQPYGEDVVGDLQEEFAQRRKLGVLKALCWMMHQYTRVFFAGIWRQCETPSGLGKIVLVATLITMPLMVAIIAWLSSVENPSPELWQMTLAGELHKILFVKEFWQAQPFALNEMNIAMFINVKSALWAMAVMGIVTLISKTKFGSIRLATLVGLSLMIAPYLLSLVYFDLVQLPPKKIGPIIAFTIFSVVYLLPMLTWWLNRKAKLSKA